jgi:hypothetical protein
MLIFYHKYQQSQGFCKIFFKFFQKFMPYRTFWPQNYDFELEFRCLHAMIKGPKQVQCVREVAVLAVIMRKEV